MNNTLWMNPGKGSVNIIVWHCFLVLIISSCGRQPGPVASTPNEDMIDSLRVGYFQTDIYPRVSSLAKSGLIITRMGRDITSKLMSKLNQQDSSFSHCGLISIENDSVFVYHCIGGEWNPDQKMKREWLYDFIKPSDSRRTGLFEWNIEDTVKQALIHCVKTWHQSGLMFDMDFNLQTNDRMYCSEMLAKALQSASGNKEMIMPVTIDSLSFLPVDRIFLRKGTKEILRMDY